MVRRPVVNLFVKNGAHGSVLFAEMANADSASVGFGRIEVIQILFHLLKEL